MLDLGAGPFRPRLCFLPQTTRRPPRITRIRTAMIPLSSSSASSAYSAATFLLQIRPSSQSVACLYAPMHQSAAHLPRLCAIFVSCALFLNSSDSRADSPSMDPLNTLDCDRLTRFIALEENFETLAAESGESLLDLYAWAAQPHIQQYLAFHRAHADYLACTSARKALSSALTSDVPAEARRAATTLLARTPPPSTTQRRAQASSPAPLPSHSSNPTSHPTPTATAATPPVPSAQPPVPPTSLSPPCSSTDATLSSLSSLLPLSTTELSTLRDLLPQDVLADLANLSLLLNPAPPSPGPSVQSQVPCSPFTSQTRQPPPSPTILSARAGASTFPSICSSNPAPTLSARTV
jgi:hypothetical protein